MNKLVLRYYQIKNTTLFLFCKFLGLFISHKHWVLFERGTDARDNAYCFYKYLKSNHPEIKVYYIIDKKSADYGKVKDDAIHFGSFKNYLMLVTAQKIISTHYGFGFPYINNKIFKFLRLYKKYYFIQHGVIGTRLYQLFGNVSPMQLFVCGAKPEYDYISSTYKHPEGVVKYTGLARYDYLHNISIKKQILVMPTWRRYLKNEEGFLNSEYYNNWQSLINNKELISLLKEKDIKLIFYPHYEMQKYISHFKTDSDLIELAEFEHYDVQTLLKESCLLITDYSSVHFDFSYMQKPVIYYQFDKKDFFEIHYEEGYFNFEIDGFGPVCMQSEDVIKCVKESVYNGFKLGDIYKERSSDFFVLHDKKNCERIFKEIISK